jgi:hypothetical protein
MHKRCFDKEINQIISKSKLNADEEEVSENTIQVKNFYSIEQFNNLMRRVKQLEERD